MTTTMQSVINSVYKVTKKIPKNFLYNVSFYVITLGRKNYAALARENGVSYKDVYIKNDLALDYTEYARNYLITLINNLATKENPGKLLVDFTAILKSFSQQIEGVTYDYDGVTGRVQKCFSGAFVIWTNGKIWIPCGFEIWLRKKDAGDNYKTKSELVQKIICEYKKHISFNEVILDGAFASKAILQFFTEQGLKYTIRIPCNRVVTIDGETHQLKNHPNLKFMRNEKYKVAEGTYKEIFNYFIAEKRTGKNNISEVVFIISNKKRATAYDHVMAFKERWPIEKFNRSAKQHLGLGHCQSTNINKQYAHFYLVMFSYVILQAMKYDKQEKSIEAVLHPIRRQKSMHELFQYLDLEKTFML